MAPHPKTNLQHPGTGGRWEMKHFEKVKLFLPVHTHTHIYIIYNTPEIKYSAI